MTNVQHSAASMEHMTPREVVELARAMGQGVIGTDPFSSAYANHHTVRAQVFYDREHSGLDLRNRWSGFCLVNPPGGITEIDKVTKKRKIIAPSLVKPAWNRTVDEWRHGRIDGALWVGFSLEQLVLLQGEPTHPLMLPTVVPCERWDFLYRPEGGGPPKPGTSPTHGAYATVLPSRRDPALARLQLRRFLDDASKFGAIVRPMGN